ncbi:hypothetical protein TKK_0019286 [Trichogramma kaykai]
MNDYRRQIPHNKNLIISASTWRRWLLSGKLNLLRGHHQDIHENFLTPKEVEILVSEPINRQEFELQEDVPNIEPADSIDDATSDIESIDLRAESFNSLPDDHIIFDNNNNEQKKFEDECLKKVYDDAEFGVGECVKKILGYYLEHCTTKRALYDLLDLIHDLLPKPNYLPRNKNFVMKFLNKIAPTQVIKRHRMCESCSNYLGEHNISSDITKCQNCNNEHVNGCFEEYDLKALLTQAFETQQLSHYIELHRQNRNNDPSVISDISSGTEYRFLEENVLKGENDVVLLWSTDGFPIANNSNGQVWPIQVQIVNVPYESRYKFRFVCGVYYSREHKPNMNTFLRPMVNSFRSLFDPGFDLYDKQTNTFKHSILVAPIASLDAPVRAVVQNIMQYNGAYGCTFCEHPGMKGHKPTTVYPTLDFSPIVRTKERMLEQARRAVSDNLEHAHGVKGPSITALIPFFCPATSFVPDYLHSVLLGVCRMLLSLWFDTKYHACDWYVQKNHRNEIDDKLQAIFPPDICNANTSNY